LRNGCFQEAVIPLYNGAHTSTNTVRQKIKSREIASLSGAGDDPRSFQISVPVQPGNSGGALVDVQMGMAVG
jgi:S1-C subfamily serine protease